MLSQRWVNLTRLPSSLGNSPAKKMEMSGSIQRMYAGIYNAWRTDAELT
jgi:hypothetical protein